MEGQTPEHWSPPTTLAELHLPPAFVADHCIRTLSYQGPMTPPEIARHWRVHDAIVVEVVDNLKAAGLVQIDSGRAGYDRLGRVRLTDGGQSRVDAARHRTWYAGALPVSLSDFGRNVSVPAEQAGLRETVRAELRALAFDRKAADEIGQALAAGAALTLEGVAADEQLDIATALRRALTGTVRLPYAVYAAGSVMRLFDPRYHRTTEQGVEEYDELDVLRTHREPTQWASAGRPAVTLTGGVLPSDVVPAYDDEARFYVAPAPLAASGGVLCVTDASANPDALAELARLWLIPGRHGTGIVLLRSGERIEVPWRAAAVLLGAKVTALPEAARRAVVYDVDVSALGEQTLAAFIARRLPAHASGQDAAGAIAELLTRVDLSNRRAAGEACRYLRDRAVYEGESFSLTPAVLHQAIDFAARTIPAGAHLRAA